MATSTELLRAAEHMESRAHLHRLNGVPTAAFDAGKAAYLLRGEAGRLQVVEAQQPKRSWPEGWPPFAVLRRAYRGIGVHHMPSTKWCDSKSPVVARRTRERWKQALDVLKRPSSP